MDSQILRDQIDEELKERIKELGSIPAGTEQYEKASAAISELYKLRVEDYKADAEYDLECRKLDAAENDRKAEAKENRLGRYITICSIVVPVVFNGYWLGRTLKFEETGVFTSIVSKGLVNKLFKH